MRKNTLRKLEEELEQLIPDPYEDIRYLIDLREDEIPMVYLQPAACIYCGHSSGFHTEQCRAHFSFWDPQKEQEILDEQNQAYARNSLSNDGS